VLHSLWVADWTNQPHQIGDAIAVQYENNRAANYDVSVVYDDGWHAA
jgi:hypothetical protein